MSDTTTTPATTAPGPDAMVRLDLPEQLEVKHLIDIVTDRLGINIVYDPMTIAGKTVTIRAPAEVPEESLLGVLESGLQLAQLALVPTGQPGWMKIIPVANMASAAPPATAPADGEADAAGVGAASPVAPVTRVFTLENADASRVVAAVQPLLSNPAQAVVSVPGTRHFVVTDFLPVVERIERIVEMIDRRDPDITVEVVPLTWSSASELASLLTAAVQAEDQLALGALPQAHVGADARSNRLVIVGKAERVRRLAESARRLDEPAELETRVYRFRAIGAAQAHELFLDVFAPAVATGAFRASERGAGGALVVAAPLALHEAIERVVADIDVPGQESPVRFYKLKNTTATDVLETLAALADQSSLPGGDPLSANDVREPILRGIGAATPRVAARADTPPQVMEAAAGAGPLPRDITSEARAAYQRARNAPPQAAAGAEESGPPVQRDALGISPAAPEGATIVGPSVSSGAGWEHGSEPTLAAGASALRTREAVIAADRNTNSIIVIAAPPVQAMYAELIERLDQRRPQVLIEVTILTLDTSDGFSLGVELADTTSVNDGRLLTFSSFGLSEIDLDTGQLDPLPGFGGNVALLGPGMANVVIQALATNSRSRVMSMPQVLVNDNEEGRLKSQLEAQTLVIIDRETGATTTSVGEPVTAGTSILVVPHISDDDYLQLEYEIELSSFLRQQRDPELPPDVQTNRVESAVTIPDGHTIVVGGLKLKNSSEQVSAVPILGQIPVLDLLFSSRDNEDSETTLFVFIRPLILRDDKFKDLKYYSGRDRAIGGIDDDYPASEPLLIR